MPIDTSANPYVVAVNNSVALEARIKALEVQHAELMDNLGDVENSLKWLPVDARIRARRRIRRLGLTDQVGPFADLRVVIENDAA